jgi:catechol-2,3-dioxygenase
LGRVQAGQSWKRRISGADVDASERFYTELLGLTKTEDVRHGDHRCVYLRCGTDHHCIALYPLALRRDLKLNAATTLMSIGIEVATDKQLKEGARTSRAKSMRALSTSGLYVDRHPEVAA